MEDGFIFLRFPTVKINIRETGKIRKLLTVFTPSSPPNPLVSKPPSPRLYHASGTIVNLTGKLRVFILG